MTRTIFSLLVLFAIANATFADSPAPPVTQLCEPMTLISAEKFDQPAAFGKKWQPGANGWMPGIGTWSIRDAATWSIEEPPSEKRPNGHESVCEHSVDLGDLVLTGEFKLGTSPQIGFVCRDTNSPNLHLGRVMITPTAIWIQKMSGIAKETRKQELTRIDAKLDTNAWYRITVEVCGDKMFARIDEDSTDEHTLEASNARFADRKGRVGFVARGEGAQFRNIALWDAKAKK
jgi:hypothetical protein